MLVRKFLVNKKSKETISNMKNENKKMFLVDVRQSGEFASGSVKGAVNIPLGTLESRIHEFKGKENIIVFCLSGGRSSQAASILAKHGISDVTNGGTWQNVANAIA
jgi:phage shock protein E